ncbi:hypothetical protein [Pseudomonas fulva]|uniref:hypothetical protein n=1 Tax=Pseudomonas fulva TaxID=47880 RepID=UPI00244CBF67|nr:hypothetical protein [Pseudomonas fulva]MDH0619158.1 hypothetical protein [Pseudomonas fulva]
MIPAIDQCAAVWKPLACTADDIALYAALTGAKNIREISELAGYVAQPGYRLIHVDDRLKTFGDIGFEIALVDDVQSSIAYYVEAALVRIPETGNRPAVRYQVWRSASNRHSLALRDISQKVFFGYIVQHHDLLLAGDEISGNGKHYWHRQVSRAIEAGLSVSVYVQAAQRFRPVTTQCGLNDIQDQAWSHTNQEPLLALVSSTSTGDW